MKVLCINASPRARGTVDTMAGIFCDELRSAGADVEKIDVKNLSIRPCIGCMACRTKGHCALPRDDGHEIAAMIATCDALVVATPVYWGNMAGTLKVMFDRIVYAMMGESRLDFPVPKHKGKKAVLLTACTTPWIGDIFAGETRGTRRALKEILGYSGFRTVGAVARRGTKSRPGVPDSTRRQLVACAARLR